MNWKEEFDKREAEGIDFVPLDFNPCCTPQSKVCMSYTKEEMLNGAIYPRTNYLFWKRVNGLKCYIIETRD